MSVAHSDTRIVSCTRSTGPNLVSRVECGCSGCGVWGLKLGVWGLGFGLWGLGFRHHSPVQHPKRAPRVLREVLGCPPGM